MSHGDWQSCDVFMMIMVIIMSHNHIKLFNCFADDTTDDFDVTNRICKTQPFDTILKDYATTRQVNVEFGGYGSLGTLASYFGPGTTYPVWSSATRSDGVLYISESG